MIKLPIDRYDQLAQLRDALGKTTFSATLGAAFKALREAYRLENVMPGIEIMRIDASDGSAILLRLDGGPLERFTLEGARKLAEAIRTYVGDPKPRKTAIINTDDGFAVRGITRSVAVFVPHDTDEPKQFTPDLALELSELIDAAARSDRDQQK